MPLADDEVRVDLIRARNATGRAYCAVAVRVDAGALRRLGLHPDQPASRRLGPSPPAWWHAEAERTWQRAADQPALPRPRGRPHPS